MTWSTEYYSIAVDRLRSQGRDIPDHVLAHISPAHSENINFFGDAESVALGVRHRDAVEHDPEQGRIHLVWRRAGGRECVGEVCP